MADDANEVKDEKQDESSVKSSETKEQSSETITLTKEQLEKEAQRRASDILARRGDKAKTLEDRVNALETENQALKKAQLESTAKKYGLTVEQVEALGIKESSNLEAVANLFSKKEEQAKEPETKKKTVTPVTLIKVDSGTTSGGSGDLTPEQVKGMSPQDILNKRKEIAKLPLTM